VDGVKRLPISGRRRPSAGANREWKLILASGSPRRRELLEGLGWSFRVVVPRITEVPRRGETPRVFALRAARDKAAWVADRTKGNAIIVAADTDVAIGGAILGKPRDAADAARMLRRLSGRTHEVITGLAMVRVEKGRIAARRSRAVRTAVTMKKLAAREIAAYVRSGEPMDKAGAYAIQGGANFMVKRIAGSYTNVVGLPLCELVELLEQSRRGG
jgi:septum formation protein